MKVISSRCLPAKLPLMSSIVIWLLLDRLHCDQWVWGAVGVMFAFLWVLAIYLVWSQKQVDIFAGK